MTGGGAMGARTSIALALLLVATAAAAPERAPDPGGHLAQAREAFHAGKYAEALEASRRAAAAGASVDALLALGGMAEFLGEFEEARRAYARAEALAPDNVAVVHRSASLAVRLGEYDRALAQLDRIARAQAWWVRWLFWYAPSRFQAGLLRRHPELELVVQLEIDVLMEKGDLEGARKLAWSYAIVEPNRRYCNEAREKSGKEPSEEAIIGAFRLAALAEPDQADCIWWFGQWLTDLGYMRYGRLMVAEGTRVTPSPGNKASGQNYLRIRLAGGREIGKRAEPLAQIGRLRYVRDGDVEGASRLLREAVRLDPRFARPYIHLARIAWDQGERDDAVALLEKAVAVDPDCWRAHRNLGKVLAILKRYPEAEGHLRKTVELFADDTGGRLAPAHVLYAQGKYEEYEKETRAALQFAERWSQPLPEVRGFLTAYEVAGPGRSVPPAPDPDMILGWNAD